MRKLPFQIWRRSRGGPTKPPFDLLVAMVKFRDVHSGTPTFTWTARSRSQEIHIYLQESNKNELTPLPHHQNVRTSWEGRRIMSPTMHCWCMCIVLQPYLQPWSCNIWKSKACGLCWQIQASTSTNHDLRHWQTGLQRAGATEWMGHLCKTGVEWGRWCQRFCSVCIVIKHNGIPICKDVENSTIWQEFGKLGVCGDHQWQQETGGSPPIEYSSARTEGKSSLWKICCTSGKTWHVAYHLPDWAQILW